MNNQDEQNNFINKKHIPKYIVGIIVLGIVFYIGNYIGERNPVGDTLAIPSDINLTGDQLDAFWKVWRILDQKFVGATTTDSQKRIYGAIQGLTASQGDPYTVFFPPEEAAMFKSEISGNFEGVGMEIGIKDGVLTVVAPLKGSPADKAGVKAGDKIIKIDDKNTSDIPVDSAVKLIRGDKGTTVTITFMRDGVSQPIVKPIVRDTIDIPTIQTEVKSGDANASSTADVSDGTGLRKDGIYVIRLFTFTAQSPDLFKTALQSFVDSGSHKLIIDLRGNPGGYLEAAWDISSWFLPAGKTIVTEDFGGKSPSVVYRSKGYDIFNGKNLDLIILVDGGSASASEIMSGALHEQGVAKLVGVKTFGKGSVQELIPITSDTSLKVTIARWLTPNGHNLSHDGLVPDYVVPITQADIDAKNDAQMNKAVDILRNEP